jgi:hypothetical protein
MEGIFGGCVRLDLLAMDSKTEKSGFLQFDCWVCMWICICDIFETVIVLWKSNGSSKNVGAVALDLYLPSNPEMWRRTSDDLTALRTIRGHFSHSPYHLPPSARYLAFCVILKSKTLGGSAFVL